ncbi:MAG: D-ribose pyranase [Microvirgula sp.]
MKKHGTLNAALSRVIAELGHTDYIVIADCGLPVPPGVERIDLALKPGLPGFLDTLAVVLEDMQVERAVLANEISQHNRDLENTVTAMLDGRPLAHVPHGEFKQITRGARAIIRTGEATPYANVILYSGTTF